MLKSSPFQLPRLASILGMGLLATVSLGCGSAATGGPAPDEDRPLALAVEELWTVGGIDGEGWETFSDRINVAFDDQGRLRIFDRVTERIHLVGADGTLQRSWGKQGEGPGELASPISISTWRDGSSAVFDLGKMGYVRFGPEGDYLEDVRLDPSKGLPGFSGAVPHPSGDLISEGGGIVIRTSASRDDEIDIPEETGIAITRYSLTGADPVTIHRAWEAPTPEGGAELNLGGGPGRSIRIRMDTPVAFQPEVLFDVMPDGRIIVVDSTTWTIEVLSADGVILDTISRPLPPTPVTEEMKTTEREQRLAALDASAESGGTGGIAIMALSGASGGGGITEMAIDRSGMVDAQREQLESMLFATELPVIDDISVDWEGRIWVERNDPGLSDDGPIDIVSSEGQYVGTLALDGPRVPVAFGPGGLVAYIDQDEFDVPTVRVVRLTGFPG